MTIQAGALDEFVTLSSLGEVVDDYGHPDQTYTPYASNVPANAKPMKGGEKFAAGREDATEFYRFLIRYNSSLATTDRITYNSNDYDILNIQPGGRRNIEYQLILARRHDA